MKRILASLLVICAAGAALAADPAGEKAIHDYSPTLAKARAYAAAMEAAEAAMAKSPALAAEANADDSSDETLAQTIAKFDKHPKLYAFFAAKGLSKEEAALVPLSIVGGCSVALNPQIAAKMASMVSPAQVAFCKTNLAELRKLKVFGVE